MRDVSSQNTDYVVSVSVVKRLMLHEISFACRDNLSYFTFRKRFERVSEYVIGTRANLNENKNVSVGRHDVELPYLREVNVDVNNFISYRFEVIPRFRFALGSERIFVHFN